MFDHIRRAIHVETSPSEKLVLLIYADCANTKDEAWPGNGYITRVSGLSLSTVKRAKRSLKEAGYLRPVNDNNTRYSLSLPPLKAGHEEPKGGHDEPGGGVTVNPEGGHHDPQKLPEEATMKSNQKKGSATPSPGKTKKLSAMDLAQTVADGGKTHMAKKSHGGSPLSKASRRYREIMSSEHEQKVLTLTSKQQGQINQFLRKFPTKAEGVPVFEWAVTNWLSVRDDLSSLTGETIKAAIPQLGLITKFASEIATLYDDAGTKAKPKKPKAQKPEPEQQSQKTTVDIVSDKPVSLDDIDDD